VNESGFTLEQNLEFQMLNDLKSSGSSSCGTTASANIYCHEKLTL
jgi:hypothetical protein